jgi:butyrate kinase
MGGTGMENVLKVLAINPGSTSTKIAIYENEKCIFKENMQYQTEDLASFTTVNEQYDFRLMDIVQVLDKWGVTLNSLDAVVGRGGLLKPLPGGTYRVDETLLYDLKCSFHRPHASNLGGQLAYGLASMVNIPAFIVDPVCVDEMEPFARFTGLPEVSRKSYFHALNLKAVAHRVAKDMNRDYSDLNLVMVHLGGGISIAAQKKGKMIDVADPNVTGPFSPERAGSLPTDAFMKMCFSGDYTMNQLQKKLNGEGGLVAHLGTNDARKVEKMIDMGDQHAKLVFEAMAYGIAKEIGAMSTVLLGKVDAIVFTGGMAYSTRLVNFISSRVEFLASVLVYPGEDELQALVEGTLRVLRGEEEAKAY